MGGTQEQDARQTHRHMNSAVQVLTYHLPVIVGKSTACRFPLVWDDLSRVGTSENAHKQLPARNGCEQGIRKQNSKAVCPVPFKTMYGIGQTNADQQGGSRLEEQTSRAGKTPKTNWTALDGAKVFACSVAARQGVNDVRTRKTQSQLRRACRRLKVRRQSSCKSCLCVLACACACVRAYSSCVRMTMSSSSTNRSMPPTIPIPIEPRGQRSTPSLARASLLLVRAKRECRLT